MTASDDVPGPSRAGRVFLWLAGALLLAAGAGAGWLHYIGELPPLRPAVPIVVAELPPRDAQSAAEPDLAPASVADETAEPSAAETAGADTTTASTPPAESAATDAAPAATAEAETPAAPETSGSEASPPEPIAEAPAAETATDTVAEPAPSDGEATDGEAADGAPPDAEADTEPAEAAPPETDAAAAEETAAAPEPAPAAEGEAATEMPAEPAEAAPAEPGTELAAATPPPAPEPEPSLAPPWKRYARPFPLGDGRPRIAIVIAELGLSRAATEAAIERLPPEITLAFNPLAPNLQAWIIKARARGHEVLIDLPMEPLAYPQEDPGPHALMASLDPIENSQRLEFLLDRADGYVGVATYMGSRFEGTADLIRPVLQELAERGLLFLSNRSAPSTEIPELANQLDLALISNDRFLDTEATRVAIDGRLQQLERLARTNKGAVAIGLGYPVTIERVGAWSETLGAKGIALAPASALVGVTAP